MYIILIYCIQRGSFIMGDIHAVLLIVCAVYGAHARSMTEDGIMNQKQPGPREQGKTLLSRMGNTGEMNKDEIATDLDHENRYGGYVSRLEHVIGHDILGGLDSSVSDRGHSDRGYSSDRSHSDREQSGEEEYESHILTQVHSMLSPIIGPLLSPILGRSAYPSYLFNKYAHGSRKERKYSVDMYKDFLRGLRYLANFTYEDTTPDIEYIHVDEQTFNVSTVNDFIARFIPVVIQTVENILPTHDLLTEAVQKSTAIEPFFECEDSVDRCRQSRKSLRRKFKVLLHDLDECRNNRQRSSSVQQSSYPSTMESSSSSSRRRDSSSRRRESSSR